MKHSNMNAQSAASASTEHLYPWRWSLKDLERVEKNGLNVFSCFSCGGGSSMGYKLAGFNVLGCCEIDPAMMKIYKKNNHPQFAFQMDVRDFIKQPLPHALYDLDILDGSPPCSVFSLAGKREDGWNKEKQFREGQELQRLDDLFFHFINIAKKLKPKVVIAENVKGLLAGNAKGYVNEIIKAFKAAGYDVQLFLFNSSKMGVPQTRERAFFIARRADLNLPKLVINFNEPLITFGEVRDEKGETFANEKGINASLLELRQPGDRSLADISKRVRRKYVGFTNPINDDERPSHTIVSGGNMFRFCDGLKLTKNDFIHCQTFPEDYDFMDQSPQYVCGMSVPPVMMAHVARAVYEQLFNGAKNAE